MRRTVPPSAEIGGQIDALLASKEILVGFLVAEFVAQLGNDFFNDLFVKHAPALAQTVWGAFIGPLIAVLTFVCPVGNVPLAAVLWSGGISFAGVIAFRFADLIVLPTLAIYRKYCGTALTLRITALMFVAALVMDALFSVHRLIPHARPVRGDILGSIELNYQLVLNAAGLFWLTARRGATAPCAA